MCTTRSWNNILAIPGTSLDGKKIINAIRSDDLIFTFETTDATKLEDFINKLESYRNCKCSPSTPCSIHLTNQGELKECQQQKKKKN